MRTREKRRSSTTCCFVAYWSFALSHSLSLSFFDRIAYWDSEEIFLVDLWAIVNTLQRWKRVKDVEVGEHANINRLNVRTKFKSKEKLRLWTNRVKISRINKFSLKAKWVMSARQEFFLCVSGTHAGALWRWRYSEILQWSKMFVRSFKWILRE